MNPNITVQPAPKPLSYVPYFYQAGLYLWRPLESHGSVEGHSYEHSSTLSLINVRDAQYAARRFQTVEDVIANGYFAIAPSDPVSAILTDRADTSLLGLDDVITQIRRRYEVFADHMRQIDFGMCAAANAIYQHEAYVGPANSRQHYAKHKSIQDLYAEKRREQTELWRDVSRLRLLLPENAQQVLSTTRKLNALTTPEAGFP